MEFTHHSLAHILEALNHWRARASAGDILTFKALDPDLGTGKFPGETLEQGSQSYLHRPYRCWMDLAELLGCRFLTPRQAPAPMVVFRFQVMDRENDWREAPSGTEKYGVQSPFSRIHKLEEPWFLKTYIDALKMIGLRKNMRILELGVNTGDSLSLFPEICGPETAETLAITGIDHCQSAMDEAARRFPKANFICTDIRDETWRQEEDPFHLIISIGTLQSPGVDGRDLFPKLLKSHLRPGGSVILGFPNVKYVDGELSYGARLKNFEGPEFSLLMKDLTHYRRFLQKKGFKVILTGKYYVFMIGLGARSPV